jgi:hypothetical protein
MTVTLHLIVPQRASHLELSGRASIISDRWDERGRRYQALTASDVLLDEPRVTSGKKDHRAAGREQIFVGGAARQWREGDRPPPTRRQSRIAMRRALFEKRENPI